MTVMNFHKGCYIGGFRRKPIRDFVKLMLIVFLMSYYNIPGTAVQIFSDRERNLGKVFRVLTTKLNLASMIV